MSCSVKTFQTPSRLFTAFVIQRIDLNLAEMIKKHDKVHSWRPKKSDFQMCALSKALSVRPDRRSSLWVWLSRVYQQTWVEWCDLLQVVFLELGDSDQSWRLLFEMLILPAYSLAQCVGPSEGTWTASQSQQYRLWSLKSTLRYICFWSKYCPKDLCASLCRRNTCIWFWEVGTQSGCR